jgi:hypothetical protein
MKKQVKKLVLTKETVHSLEERTLEKAAGGLTTGFAALAAVMSYMTSCPG